MNNGFIGSTGNSYQTFELISSMEKQSVVIYNLEYPSLMVFPVTQFTNIMSFFGNTCPMCRTECNIFISSDLFQQIRDNPEECSNLRGRGHFACVERAESRDRISTNIQHREPRYFNSFQRTRGLSCLNYFGSTNSQLATNHEKFIDVWVSVPATLFRFSAKFEWPITLHT